MYTYDDMYLYIRVYIYIYGRGRRFPEMTSIRIIELVKKQCFTVVKWTFFIYFFSLLMSFNYGSNFFRPSKLKSSLEHHNFVFLVVLFSPLELRGTFCVLYQRSLEEGIIYCVSPGIFDVMLFFIGNSQCFLHFLKFSECCESAVTWTLPPHPTPPHPMRDVASTSWRKFTWTLPSHPTPPHPTPCVT